MMLLCWGVFHFIRSIRFIDRYVPRRITHRGIDLFLRAPVLANRRTWPNKSPYFLSIFSSKIKSCLYTREMERSRERKKGTIEDDTWLGRLWMLVLKY